MTLQVTSEALERADAAVILIGLLLLAGAGFRLFLRGGWRRAFHLHVDRSPRFTFLDIVAPYLLLLMVSSVCVHWFESAQTATSQVASAPSERDPRGEALAGVAARAPAIVLLLIVGSVRVPGGLRRWGLRFERPGWVLSRAILGYLMVWPVIASLHWSTKQFLHWWRPEWSPVEHETLQFLRTGGQPQWVVLFLLAAAAFVAPVVEELLFRGVMQRWIEARSGSAWLGIVISSILFGLVHSNIETVPPLIFFGIVLGFIYARTGSLTLVIILHVLFNTKTLAWLAMGA